MLLFAFLFNKFLLSQNINCQNTLPNKTLINNYTQRKTLKSRCLAELENSYNTHCHNDPELKKIIDQLNQGELNTYQQSNDTCNQLHELLEKNETKTKSRNSEQRLSKIEKKFLKTYEKFLTDKNRIMIISDIYTNEYYKSNDKNYKNDKNDKNNKSCECANNKKSSNKLSLSNKVNDNYLDNLKTRCVGSVGACALSSAATEFAGNVAAASAVKSFIQIEIAETIISKVYEALAGISLLSQSTIVKATSSIGTFSAPEGLLAASFANSAFFSYGITALFLILIAVIFVLLYIWMRKRRKRSWKHEYKKHLCT
ncbi:PIR protein [Plasmodium sp. gorilla clade G1]|nr:PIR protein [Plasmodium sp. gorilla clade G1]